MVSDPTCSTSASFMELGAAVVREVAKMGSVGGSSSGSGASKAPRVAYDQGQHAIIIRCLGGPPAWHARAR